MKLKNKKTGEIVEFGYLQSDHVAPLVLTTYENDKPEMYSYNSLTELNEEWEDYEEPKDVWWLDNEGNVNHASRIDDYCFEKNKQIGNYFKTKEEAEKAVEKLKAWKRLKDNGFKFEGVEKRGRHINFYQGRSYETDEQCQQAMKDLDLLFSGEGD